MSKMRCMNCMGEIEGYFCSNCGFDNQNYDSIPEALHPNIILNGRYLVGKVLGQGGFGITYIGFDLLLNVKVAVKEYFPRGQVMRDHTVSNQLQWNTSLISHTAQKNGCENILKEARKMAKVEQIPEVVRVRDTFLENQTAYIVMDFIEGQTLKDKLMKEGTMKYSECIALLKPLIKCLEEVHKEGIIHRDLSPDNLMLQSNGKVRLLDLGAAKDLTSRHSNVSRSVSDIVTKKGYSPPEQYMESGVVGTWTDVYAMCATIYYCIIGKVVPEAMERLMNDTLSFDYPVREAIPQKVQETLRAGLAIKPEQRIRTMTELLQRLSEAEQTSDINAWQNINKTSKTDVEDYEDTRKKQQELSAQPMSKQEFYNQYKNGKFKNTIKSIITWNYIGVGLSAVALIAMYDSLSSGEILFTIAECVISAILLWQIGKKKETKWAKGYAIFHILDWVLYLAIWGNESAGNVGPSVLPIIMWYMFHKADKAYQQEYPTYQANSKPNHHQNQIKQAQTPSNAIMTKKEFLKSYDENNFKKKLLIASIIMAVAPIYIGYAGITLGIEEDLWLSGFWLVVIVFVYIRRSRGWAIALLCWGIFGSLAFLGDAIGTYEITMCSSMLIASGYAVYLLSKAIGAYKDYVLRSK